MGTETEPKSSKPSEIQPLAEFDPDKEPVAELDERDVIEPLKKTMDDTGDQEQEKEPDTPGEIGADTEAEEQEIPLDEPGGQVESDAEEAADDASDESEIRLDKTDGEADEPDSDEKVISFAAASNDSDSDGGADSEDETKDSDADGDGDSPVNEAELAVDPPEEPSENANDEAVAAEEAKDSDADGDGNLSDKEEQPAGDAPKDPTENNDDGADDGDADGNSSDEEEQAAANNNKNDFAGLDDNQIDDGIDSQRDEKQENPGEGPAKKKAVTIEDPGKIKELNQKKEPLPEGTAKTKKGKKPVKDAATSKKLIVSIIIIFMVAGAVIYSRPALFGLKGRLENALPEKAEIETPAEQTEIQPRQPEPPGKNDDYLSKIEDVTRLREELLAKKEEIYRLKLHYRNGITELKDQLYLEMQDDNISTFAQALKNKRIELGLRTIQRREVYIQELEKPDQWVHNGSEELLFLKRKALLDLQMTDIASGIDLNRHMRYMNAALQKYQPSADKLAVDPPPAELTPLETIWSAILNQQAEKVQAPIGQENKKIIAEICSGNYGRIAELTAITPEAARCLSRMKGSELFLNGLTQLSPKEAEYLFKWQGNWICLNNVKNLSPAVARHLFKWEGNWISLNGLAELPPELALYLTEWNGNQLELMGLNYEKYRPNKRTLKYLALWETMGGKLFVSEDIRKEMARVM